MQNLKKARLVLQDGTVYEGTSFGYEKSVSGEVVWMMRKTGFQNFSNRIKFIVQRLSFPIIHLHIVIGIRKKVSDSG